MNTEQKTDAAVKIQTLWREYITRRKSQDELCDGKGLIECGEMLLPGEQYCCDDYCCMAHAYALYYETRDGWIQ